MNIVVPKFSDVKTGLVNFFTGLGLVPSILLIVFVGAVVIYAFGSFTGYIESAWTNHKVNQLQAEADKYKAQADKNKEIADQAIGAAASYKAQTEQLQAERTELLNAQPQLKSQVEQAHNKVAQIRNTQPRPIDDAIRQRIDDVGSKLDALYPDR